MSVFVKPAIQFVALPALSAEFMKVLYVPGHASEFSAKAVEMTREFAWDGVTEQRVSDFAPRMDSLRGMARTMTLGITVIGLAIASAIAATAPHTGTFEWVRDAGVVVYLVALVLAAAYMIDLVRRAVTRRRERSCVVPAAVAPPESAEAACFRHDMPVFRPRLKATGPPPLD